MGVRVADEQIAPGYRSVVKTANQSVLGRLVEVDHHISAEDQVELPAERDGVHQVKGPEDHIVPHGGGNGVAAVLVGGKILLLPVRRDRHSMDSRHQTSLKEQS